MGGAVSSGRDNGELVDNLKGSDYIRTPQVEAVFRAVDRGRYMPEDSRNVAYKDLAWKSGQLHLSAPCIYSEVMEALELKEGLTFLNVGSGTGYLSTMVGLLLGSHGVNHGIEIHQVVLDYANKRLAQFIKRSPAVDEFHFCAPYFVQGNGLCLPPGSMHYDRVYCGASCPEDYITYFKQLINVGGVLVMPLNDSLLQVRRTSATEWTSRSLLSVSFASLLVPSKQECSSFMRAMSVSPASLQVLVRGVIRGSLHRELLERHPNLRDPPERAVAPKKARSRRICIPIEDDSDVELDGLHDLDRASGAGEMNALLSLVLSMGHNRVAGALRFDNVVTTSDSDDSSAPSAPELPDATAAAALAVAAATAAAPSEGEVVSNQDNEARSVDAPMSATLETVNLDGPEPSVAPYPESNTSNGSVDFTPRSPDRPPGIEIAAPGSCDATWGSRDVTPEATPRSQDATSGSREVTWSTTDASPGSQEAPPERSSELDTDTLTDDTSGSSPGRPECRRRRTKRAKLDSGIGEEASPRRWSLLRKGASRSSSEMLHLNHDAGTCRRRSMKRSRAPPAPADSSTSEDSSSSEDSAPAPPRHKQKRGAPTDACEVRRARISQLLQASVSCLPLPSSLQRYVNLDRPFRC